MKLLLDTHTFIAHRGTMKRSSTLSITLIATSLLCSTYSFADDPDPKVQEQARKLYDDAKKAMVAGDYLRACPRLEAAKALLPKHINTGILLAECYHDAKRLASASKEFQRVLELAQAQQRKDKVADIKSRLAEMEPRISTLTIVVPASIVTLPGFAIQRDGIEISRELWGTPIAMDPGTFELKATALNHAPWQKKSEIKGVIKGVGERLEITIDPAWSVPTAPKPKAASTWQRPTSFAVMGVGVAALGVGAVLGVMALDKNAESNDGFCLANNHCNQTGYDLRKDALTYATGSTISLIAGGVLTAGGLTLLLVSPSRANTETTGGVSVNVGLGYVGVRGAF